jgi:hypothetical protein
MKPTPNSHPNGDSLDLDPANAVVVEMSLADMLVEMDTAANAIYPLDA